MSYLGMFRGRPGDEVLCLLKPIETKLMFAGPNKIDASSRRCGAETLIILYCDLLTVP
jgi:hypothetical protein